MKTRIVAVTALLIMLTPAIAFSFDPQSEVKKIAEVFVKSADSQDAELLSSVLHPKAMQYVLFGSQILISTADEYIAQVRAKQLGGKAREIEFTEALLTGEDTAFIKIIAEGGGLIFKYHLTVFKIEGQWKIMTITTKVER
ncbi:MAG: nuclear transport factor 2 family protein, partial [Cyclobacteriaceae bacterium]